MRRKDRQLSKEDSIKILDKCEYGVLSLVTEENKPYNLPLNYCSVEEDIYFHCATKGMKLDLIKNNNNASFCVVGKTELEPENFSTKYESCVVSGKAFEVDGEEKIMALKGLVKKYSPDFIAKGDEYIDRMGKVTCIIKITCSEIIGKARL